MDDLTSPPVMDQAAAEAAYGASILHGEPMPAAALRALLDACRRFAAAGDPARVPPPTFIWVDHGGPEAARRNLEGRVRRQAERAAAQTAFYGDLFARIGLDPAALTLDDVGRIPVLRKEAVLARPYDFVCRDASVAHRTHTGGTGGAPPLGLCFSAYEIGLAAHETALGAMLNRSTTEADVILIPANSRQVLSSITLAAAMHLLGAAVVWGWLSRPDVTLAQLAETHGIPGKHPKITRTAAYPSLLGEMVSLGLAQGYGPGDFGLRQLDLGGEIATDGLRRRARALIGEDVTLWEGYGMSETWGAGGGVCPAGNLHFEYTGLWEFLDPDTYAPAAEGTVATCVASTLPPFRDTTLLLRYDTEDLVRPLGACPCGFASQVTTKLLGKRHRSVRHADGWTTPRDVLEALEGVDAVRLPARCGFWAEDGGVAVEVVAPPAARAAVGDALESRGVPLRRLVLRDGRDALERPYPLRVDML